MARKSTGKATGIPSERAGFYAALRKLGAEPCPECHEYVLLASHDCTAYWEAKGWAQVRAEAEARYRAAREIARKEAAA